MDSSAFAPHSVLAFLDELESQVGTSALPSIEAAWEAAWIACMSGHVRHELAAQVALATVVVDLGHLAVEPERAAAVTLTVLAASRFPTAVGWSWSMSAPP